MPLCPSFEQLESVAAWFRGVGHPTRLQILIALRHAGVLSPKQLAEIVEPRLSLGTISHHTRALTAAGLVAPARTEQVRGAVQHFYRLSARGHEFIGFVDHVVE